MRRIVMGAVVTVACFGVVLAQQSRGTSGGGGVNAAGSLVGTWKLTAVSPAIGSGDPVVLMLFEPDG
jgi:hypothetical protein